MFAANPAIGVPDPVESGVRPQVIDVPVRPLRCLLVVRNAGAHASRPEGAAHINVEAGSKLEGTELPDLDQLVPGTIED
jgi:hypothetical protein